MCLLDGANIPRSTMPQSLDVYQGPCDFLVAKGHNILVAIGLDFRLLLPSSAHEYIHWGWLFSEPQSRTQPTDPEITFDALANRR
jgi:hypothetical protein